MHSSVSCEKSTVNRSAMSSLGLWLTWLPLKEAAFKRLATNSDER